MITCNVYCLLDQFQGNYLRHSRQASRDANQGTCADSIGVAVVESDVPLQDDDEVLVSLLHVFKSYWLVPCICICVESVNDTRYIIMYVCISAVHDIDHVQWNLQIKYSLGAELLSSFQRLSSGGRFIQFIALSKT